MENNETPIKNENKGFKFLIAIALGNVALSIFYIIWDIVGEYSLSSDIVGLIISIVIGLFMLSGMPWMRYLFAASCFYYAFFRIISLISLIGSISTQDPDWFLLCYNIVTLIYFIASAVILLTNKDIKAYFAPENK